MNQNDKVLEHMRTFGSITPLEAFSEYGIMRLASRVADLKHCGHNIITETEVGKNRFGDPVHYSKYTLIGE